LKPALQRAALLFFLICLGLGGTGKAFPPAGLALPRASTLPNGFRVIVKPGHDLGVVAINLVIRAGSRHEEAQESGAAHFLEHMLFRGSSNYRPGKVQEFVEGLGGGINAGTLRDFTHIYATLPSGAFEEAFAALAYAVLHPSLETMEVERERAIILSEISRHHENPLTVMWDLAHLALFLFEGHPYGRPVNGTPESVNRLTGKDLLRFHRRWYVPNNMAVVVVGDVSEARVLAAARKAFGKLSPAPVSQPLGSGKARLQTRGGEFSYYHGGSLAYVGLVVKAPAVSSPREVCATDLLLVLLAEGKKSRLWIALRGEETLARAVGAEFLTSREPSPFLLWASCPPEKVAEVKAKMEREIAAIAEGKISPGEIAATKHRLETSFWLSNETYTDQADVLGFYEAIASYRFAAEYVSRLQAVSLAEVKQAATRFLVEQAKTWLLLLPRNQQ